MTLPRLVLWSQEPRAIARVLRGALRLRTETIRLVNAPRTIEQHLLDIDVPGEGRITLLAEPTGEVRPEGHCLRVAPVTRVQMAEIFALLERLDEPSTTVPPEEGAPVESGSLPPEDTIIEAVASPFSGGLPSSASADRFARPQTAPIAFRPAPPPKPAAPPPPPPDPRIGRVIAGKYRVEAALGSGASATVYRATHVELRRAVAVKVLHTQNQSEAQFVKRFKAEALTASRLEHVNVTRIMDFGQESDGSLYLVMELVTGLPLETIVGREGALPQVRVVDIAIQVCRALTFAHELGVIHRDIKPENVMIVPDKDDDGDPCDLVKVCDFGLAKLRDPDAEELTVAGMLMGSPAYMSPEQTRGEQLDARADIYALGVTMFEALTGTLPHEAMSLAELFVKKVTTPPRRVSQLVAGIHPQLDDLVWRSTATDPRARPASAREVRAELRALRDDIRPRR